MEKELGKNYPIEVRKTFLKDNCDEIVDRGYMKPFSQNELFEKKDRLAEVDIEISNLKDKKALLVAEIKNQLDPFLAEKEELLRDIKTKAAFVNENCFKFLYDDEGTAAFYNAEGDMVESRPLTEDEKQKTIFQITREVSNNN